MIDWINSIFPELQMEYPELLQHDNAKVYLIPEIDHYTFMMEWLKDNFYDIFYEELAGWTSDESRFPPITWDNFQKFCVISHQSMVFFLEGQEEEE